PGRLAPPSLLHRSRSSPAGSRGGHTGRSSLLRRARHGRVAGGNDRVRAPGDRRPLAGGLFQATFVTCLIPNGPWKPDHEGNSSVKRSIPCANAGGGTIPGPAPARTTRRTRPKTASGPWSSASRGEGSVAAADWATASTAATPAAEQPRPAGADSV